MADNETTGSGKPVATDKVTYSTDSDQNVQLIRPVHVAGAEGSKTVVDVTTSDGVKQIGSVAHDSPAAGAPVLVGGYASAAAPSDVSTDADVVRSWMLKNGANAVVLTAAGALIGGDATNGLKVDPTRVPLPIPASTGTLSNVNDQATTTTLLSSSATRKGFRIVNDSTQDLFIKYGTTASLTDYTAMIPPGGFYAENYYYGRVDGIWRADASGAARITELT